jgi:hypothetical protein
MFLIGHEILRKSAPKVDGFLDPNIDASASSKRGCLRINGNNAAPP